MLMLVVVRHVSMMSVTMLLLRGIADADADGAVDAADAAAVDVVVVAGSSCC